MADQQDIDNEDAINKAIGFCLDQQDNGALITPGYLKETFPAFHSDLVKFFDDETEVLGKTHFAKTSLTNKMISHFELQNQLGKGSFGEVWRAWDTSLRREVAIKLPRHQDGDSKIATRFLREARAASRLDHPCIVRVLQVGTSDGTPFICTELVDGVPLSDWSIDLWSTAPVSAAMTITRVTSKIAAGMAHAHDMGIIHRDLNPRNILIINTNAPKILDFGVAKSQRDASTVTVHGEVLGTPAYVSPEQANGRSSDLDGRSDIFSIGVLLYEMLTGKRPFRGDLKRLLHQIRFESPEDPRTLNARIPRDLALVCLKCLEKDPADRYQTATELHEALETIATGKSVEISPPKPPPEANRFRYVATSSCALLLVSTIAIQSFTPPSDEPATSSTQDGKREPPPNRPVERPDNRSINAETTEPLSATTTAPNDKILQRKRAYHVEQIGVLAARMMKAFDQHFTEIGGHSSDADREFQSELREFEQRSNRLKQQIELNADWQPILSSLQERMRKLSVLKEKTDVGPDAEILWTDLDAHMRWLVRPITVRPITDESR